RQALVNSFGDAVRVADFVTPPSPTLLGRFIKDNRYWIWGENTLYVGFVPLILCVMALRFVVSGFSRTIVTGIVLMIAGYILALGFVSPSLGIRLPLGYLARAVPMLAGLRATQRFALVIYFGVLLLSSCGFASLVRNWPRRMQMLTCSGVCGLFLLEVFP